MSEIEKIDFPEEFVEYAKKKLAEKEEYVRHWAKFGPPMLKEWAQMILIAADKTCKE